MYVFSVLIQSKYMSDIKAKDQ